MLAILALGLLIIIHEGGHFLVARLSGMRVDRFSIGFGPRLFSFKRGETLYQIAAIPLGGFVQIAGLTPGEEGMEADDPRAYPNRPVYQRLATIFAGPATNYIFAALLLAVIFLIWGVPGPGRTPVVDDLIEGKPAAAAGFQPGDEIERIDGQPVRDINEVVKRVSDSQGHPLTVAVLRDGKPVTLHVTPKEDGGDYRIGIALGVKEQWEQVPTAARLGHAVTYPFEFSAYALQTLVQGGFSGVLKHGSGPIGMVKEMRKRIEHGPRHALMIIALISIYLGMFNLLPLPGLDGGRLAFLGWEAISRRRVNQRVEQAVHMVGVLLLLALIVVISFKNDLHIGSLFHR